MKTFFRDRPRSVAKFFLAAVVWIALLAAVVWGVMLLWNWLMPAVFAGARSIDYWQALGLLVLSKVLLGGGRGPWKHRRRWDHMTFEEREQLKRRFRSRWGGACPRDAGTDADTK